MLRGVECRHLKEKKKYIYIELMTPPSLPISELAATQFFATRNRQGRSFRCQFLNRQRRSFRC